MFNSFLKLGRVLGLLDVESPTVETTIVSILNANENVKALVSERIFPNVIPQGELVPAITYQVITGKGVYHTQGVDELKQTLIQIVSWTESYEVAEICAKAVDSALNGFSGTIDTIKIQGIFLNNSGDMPVLNSEEALKRYGIRQDFKIWFCEN